MKINYIGYNFTHRYKFVIDRPEGASSNIIILTKMPAYFFINDNKIYVSENSVVIIKAKTPYRYESTSKYYRDDRIHFELTSEEEKQFRLPYNSVNSFDDISTMSFYVEKLYREVYGNSEHKQRKIDLFFELLYLELSEKFTQQNEENRYKTTLYNVRALLYDQPERRYYNSGFAQNLGMSVSHFQHIYRKTFGISPTEDAILARVERAKYLLKNTNLKVMDIAEALGYKSEIQFMRQFKKVTSTTPSEYRKLHQ